MKCRWASLHWIRFGEIETPESLELSRLPTGAASWKIGPDVPVGPDGTRLPSSTWCAVGLYHRREDADAAVADPHSALPCLGRAREAWHVSLQPIAHRGECNHLDRTNPGEILRIEGHDPGGRLIVMTTAGFLMGPDLDIARVVDFRRNVDQVRGAMVQVPGNVATQVFTPHGRGEDGVTTSVWRDDAAMIGAAYRPGAHRLRVDRHMQQALADRTSFTRFRPLSSSGSWNGLDPLLA